MIGRVMCDLVTFKGVFFQYELHIVYPVLLLRHNLGMIIYLSLVLNLMDKLATNINNSIVKGH